MKRHGWLTSTLRLVPVVAIAAAAMIAMAPADAGAAFNVKTFQCSSTGVGVDVDVSGLGNTNVCVEGTSDVSLFCACENSGGNCPNAANKQTRSAGAAANETLQPKNGRVRTTFSLQGVPPSQTQDVVCTAAAGTEVGDLTLAGPPLSCPGGQKAALVGSDATTTFTLCTTTSQPGEECTCAGQTPLTDPISCGPTTSTSTDVGADCVALFPEL
jgi:hypothetical protein